jgi:hypothetical protein
MPAKDFLMNQQSVQGVLNFRATALELFTRLRCEDLPQKPK